MQCLRDTPSAPFLLLILVFSAAAAYAGASAGEPLVPITDSSLLEKWGFALDATNVSATPEVAAQLAMTPLELALTQAIAGEEASADVVEADVEPRSPFGTSTVGRSTVDHAAFRPVRTATDHQDDGNGGRYCLAGYPFFSAGFEGLPHGARLTALQFWAFDASAETAGGLALRTCNQNFAAPSIVILGVYSSFGSAGYDTATVFPSGDLDDIDTRCTYSVQFRLDNSTNLCSEGDDLRLVGAQARWIRQLPPAPQMATFIDVPTSHPLFQEIEALAASGITDGCGTGRFCPNEVITRSEIGALLARALGLGWN